MLDHVVDAPIAWTRDALTEADWLVRLDAEAIAELEAAAGWVRANPLPTILLDAAEFRLDACRAVIGRVRRILASGIGFVVLDRLPLERLSRDDARVAYWLLAQLVARPVAQSWDGKMIYDVLDAGVPPGNGVRPDRTNYEQNFHTDNSYNLCPPDYVALLCLQTAKEGGVNSVVSFTSAHNRLLREQADLVGRLYEPYWFDRQREHAPDDAKVLSHPLFEWDGVRLAGRLSHFQVINGHKLAGVPLDGRGSAALEALEAVMMDPALNQSFYFERGQIQVIDNRRLGHRRTRFVDHPEPERKRHLVRLWLRDAGRRCYNG